MRVRTFAVMLAVLVTAGTTASAQEIFSDGFEWGSTCAWSNDRWYVDLDDDGFGDSSATGEPWDCPAPPTLVSNNLDCDDLDEDVRPDAAELCDAVDNDCDPASADGAAEPTLGSTCTTGLPGICSPGTMQCTAAAMTCVQNNLPILEICGNGEDEDCDGVVDNSNDQDGDEYGHCDNDCCDAPGPCSANPELVNPGAFEVVGNGIDDDCDPATSDTSAPPDCSTAEKLSGVSANDVAHAMDLCQSTTADPPQSAKKWGVISAQMLAADGSPPTASRLADMQNWQSAILANYGTAVAPHHGPTMAGLSTGRMRDEGDPGFISPQPGENFGVSHNPPPVYWVAHGNQLPSSLGCSGVCPSGNDSNDSVLVRLTIRVPTNAQSFSYKFKFYTSEYPEWTCTAYNDFYLALLNTSLLTIPTDTNISFDPIGNPFSVNNGFFDVCNPAGCYTCPAGTAELAGTGMQADVGGGTGWMLTTAPVKPGETIIFELVIFDVGDCSYDSLVLLDDFQWDVNPATVGTSPIE